MLAYPRRLESRPWFAAGRSVDGLMALQQLREQRRRLEGADRYCVYVHVPFCASICSFCSLYTRAVSPGAHDVLDEYVALVLDSIDAHPWRGLPQAPTTVHFGGGTPLMLGPRRFGALVRGLREAFGTSPACEWAIETTTSSMDEPTLDLLAELGFQRIHLGIQTLDDPTRIRIGRHETGARAIERIGMLLERGFFTSVDLIIGFDNVDGEVVADDLRRLYDAGVRMFSICELRERGAVRLGIRNEADKTTQNYRLWALIWEFMADSGLKPIHLGQFARSQDDNLYFTFPARGEDCAAIGPYAHGCAGNLYYGNRLLPDYYGAIRSGQPPIGVAVEYDAEATAIRSLERDLLAHRVAGATLTAVADAYPDVFPSIRDEWLRKDLMRDAGGDAFVLSRDGSWFVGNMIADARAMLESAAGRSEKRGA
jgi:coproporphyrinogen III oxidase-like Fe-S oxidoreductase